MAAYLKASGRISTRKSRPTYDVMTVGYLGLTRHSLTFRNFGSSAKAAGYDQPIRVVARYEHQAIYEPLSVLCVMRL
jgi:hypothetical protein